MSSFGSCPKVIPNGWQGRYTWNTHKFFAPYKDKPLVCSFNSLYKMVSTCAYLDSGSIPWASCKKKKINLLGSETVLDSEQWVSYPDVQLTLLDPVLLGWLSVAVCMFLRAGDVKIRIAHGYRNRSYPCFPPLLYEFKAKTHTHKKKNKSKKPIPKHRKLRTLTSYCRLWGLCKWTVVYKLLIYLPKEVQVMNKKHRPLA